MTLLVPAPSVAVKPSMRGYLHAVAGVTSIVTGLVLVVTALTLRTSRAGWSTAVYAVSMLFLFAISALYHRVTWSPRAEAMMKRLDHSMVFVFIAGTYTPIAALGLPRRGGDRVIVWVWGAALLGVLLKLLWPHVSGLVPLPLYAALGWIAIALLPGVLQSSGVAALVLVATGGGTYIVGGIIFATGWPDPTPKTFGYHEVFHSFTLAAAICQYIAIWLILL